MVAVTRDFADRLADVARLLEQDQDDVEDDTLRRLTGLGVELVPGGTAAAVTIATGPGALTFAASDPRLDELYEAQFADGQGPVVEALTHNEPRRVDDTASERRWPGFCRAAYTAGFRSVLALPLRTDRQPAGTVALYGAEPAAFHGVAHDIALLFAAQGGTAVLNGRLYLSCRRLVGDLHAGLESRAVIEQAKGMVHADLGVTPAEAFGLLRRYSQNTNQRVRKVSADVVHGRLAASELRGPSRTG